jgi:type IV secretory pathway VirB4 component
MPSMRFRELLRDINRFEQKLENALLYVDFLAHELPIILLKDGSVLILFHLSGLDYEGLSEDEKQQFSHYARTALEQLPDEGTGFMLSNLLIRDTPEPIPLKRNSSAHSLIQFVQSKKQAFWDEQIASSFGNRILCGLRYFNPKRREPGWNLLIEEGKLFQFYQNHLRASIVKLEQGFLALQSALARFGFGALDRERSFCSLYQLINFAKAPAYRPDLSLNAQLAQSQYLFRPSEECVVVNGIEYCSVVGMKYSPPSSLAMYLRRFYELGFPLVLRQSIGFASRQQLYKQQDFDAPIALALSTVDPKNLKYVEEVREFRNRIENENELPVWWHFSVLVRARDRETLRTRRAQVTMLLKEIGSFGIAEKRNLKAAFFSLFPGHDRFYLRRALIATANAGDLLSAYVLSQGDSEPVDYLQDRLHGVFAYNPFTSREKAHHRAVCGPTVGGKSFFVVKDLLSHLIANPMIWVVDLSNSYGDLFELLREEMPDQTAIMRVSRHETNFHFNPFRLEDPLAPVSDDQFEFCMGLLKLMAGRELMTPVNELSIREGLAEFFNAYKILLRNGNDGCAIPPLTLLSNILEMELKQRELASAFQLWTLGRRGQIFNTGTDTLQSARYCYFDLRDLEGEQELMTAIVYVIFSKVYRDIADENLRSVEKRFVLDEAHRYITDPAFSHWISLVVRTGRHWNIMLDLITQSLADLDDPSQPWSKAIITNLKQAFFFAGQKDVEASLRKLQLTDYHIQQYKRLDPSRFEVFYWSVGGLRRILRPVADPYTYWLATTDARERTIKRLMKRLHGENVRNTIEELVQLTGHCCTTEERLAILEPYLTERLAAEQMAGQELAETHAGPGVSDRHTTTRRA